MSNETLDQYYPGLEGVIANETAIANVEGKHGDGGLEYRGYRIEDLATEVSYEETAFLLLHGDLQAKNLIVSRGELVAVDPMPVVGPALFDIAFWIAKSDHARSTRTYVDEVSRLRPGLDGDALLRWTWALAVLEYRPYLQRGAAARQQFIDEVRELATA